MHYVWENIEVLPLTPFSFKICLHYNKAIQYDTSENIQINANTLGCAKFSDAGFFLSQTADNGHSWLLPY